MGTKFVALLLLHYGFHMAGNITLHMGELAAGGIARHLVACPE